MKPGAKRRRSKEEIKEAKRQEANKAKEMADALILLQELKSKDTLHQLELAGYRAKEKTFSEQKAQAEADRHLLQQMEKEGVMKISNDGKINIADNPNERAQMKAQYEKDQLEREQH